jgi:hypothetical protein
MSIFALLLACILPAIPRDVSDCDTLEINHYYDGDARKIFTQLIFRDWQGVQGWCMADKALVSGNKVYTHSGKVVRFVRLEVTHTQHDPELNDRERIPVEQRRITR